MTATQTQREMRREKSSLFPQKRFIQSPHRHTHCHLSTTSDKSSISNSTSTFKTWPMPMIESKGDYQQDAAILEPIIGGPLYSAQTNLPPLPIPNLKDTIETFLPTALPLIESEQEGRQLIDKCKSFPQQAQALHQKLIHRKEGEQWKNSSWLQLWWNTDGYLKLRDPVTVNISYFFHFVDDPTIAISTGSTSTSTSTQAHLGIKRGAAMLHASAEFRKLICSGSFPHQSVGRKEPKTPLCSVAFKYMFNACRIPRREMDTYRIYDPSLYTHCIVARKGRYFAVDFVDCNGDPISIQVLEERLQQCVDLADGNNYNDDNGKEVPMLGWLTSSDRDSWADAREEMLRVGGMDMTHALEKLESGALMLCLDDEEPFSKKQCADVFWTGNVSSGHNRWFDKSIQLFCTQNGKAGLQGEHSMMDGMPMIAFADYITKQSYASAEKKSSNNNRTSGGGGVADIFAKCYSMLTSENSKVDSMISKAKSDFYTLVTDHEQHVQSFQGYGGNFIKKAGYSPDAYAQMAIQLAVYRLHGKQVGTYEATQMRPFLHGRTETTRTVSKQSYQFVKCMGMMANFNDNAASSDTKKTLLKNAVKSHVKYIGDAAKGKGVDRHLFGMSMLADEKDGMPDLYSDPVFIRSKTWKVSTSHLTHENIENWGFGEVVPNGLGVAYAVKSDSCIFNVAARKEHGWTERFGHLLEEALLEMKGLHDSTPTSKL